jgi:hypothetical protein
MSDDQYVKDLEKQHDELMDRLATAESFIKKHCRRKGTYPVFKLIRKQVKKRCWQIECEYLTNCDCRENVIPTIKYTLNNPLLNMSTGLPKDDVIGFQYWRQPLNYRWAVSGMSRFLDLKLKLMVNIDIDEKTGEIHYRTF